MALTSTRQRNAVSQGLALGLLIRGRPELPTDKMTVDLAFEGAWKAWAHRTQFSQVSTDVRKGLDGLHVVTRADHDKQVAGVHWVQEDYRWVIKTREPDWDVDDPEDVQFALRAIGTDIPLEAWLALTDDFIARIDR